MKVENFHPGFFIYSCTMFFKRKFNRYFSALFIIVSVGFIFTFSACSSRKQTLQAIQGSWIVDSIYDYYNGFGFMNTQPNPRETFRYLADSIMYREGMNRQRLYHYYVTDSSIVVKDVQGNLVSDHKIELLSKSNMVLRKDKKEIFPGKNQERYEVRFFSRIDSAGVK